MSTLDEGAVKLLNVRRGEKKIVFGAIQLGSIVIFTLGRSSACLRRI